MAADRLTLQQVAEYLRIEPIQVSRLVRQGDIPFSGPVAKPLFDREEIDAWASRRILGMNGAPDADGFGNARSIEEFKKRFGISSGAFCKNTLRQ